MNKKLFSKVFTLLLVVVLLFAIAPTVQAQAALDVPDWVSQTPVAPTSTESVLVLINQPTIEGENVALEYWDGTTYTKMEASYDVENTYADANWSATIPPKTDGTSISYQLYMYTDDITKGTEDRFSGWNWGYTVGGAPATVYVDDGFTNAEAGFGVTKFATIQGGIDAVAAGGTVNVAAGEHIEVGQIVIDKNLTIVGADKATTIIKPAQDTGGSGDARGWFLVNSGIEFNLSNVTLDGQGKLIYQAIRSLGTGTINNNIITNMKYTSDSYMGYGVVMMGGNMTISNNTLSNIGRVGIMPYGSGVTAGVVSGNTYIGKGDGDNLDYGIEVGGGAKVTISGNTISGIGVSSTDWSNAAIMITDAYPTVAPASVFITNNTLSNNYQGIAVGHGASDGVIVVAEYNDLSGTPYAITTTSDLVNLVDGSPNWWGQATGPAEGQIIGNVGYSPWCADAECTSFAPDEDGVVELSGEISVPGRIWVGTPGLTYHLAADTVIQNNSPCFVIHADNVKILGEPGAKCIPTDGASDVVIDGGLQGITVDTLEIDGTGQSTLHGIYVDGVVTDYQFTENKIHGLGGDGIHFAAQPLAPYTGEIKGNLFFGNTGVGVNNPAGTSDVNVQYNAWGDLAEAGGTNGDGVGAESVDNIV